MYVLYCTRTGRLGLFRFSTRMCKPDASAQAAVVCFVVLVLERNNRINYTGTAVCYSTVT